MRSSARSKLTVASSTVMITPSPNSSHEPVSMTDWGFELSGSRTGLEDDSVDPASTRARIGLGSGGKASASLPAHCTGEVGAKVGRGARGLGGPGGRGVSHGGVVGDLGEACPRSSGTVSGMPTTTMGPRWSDLDADRQSVFSAGERGSNDPPRTRLDVIVSAVAASGPLMSRTQTAART